MRDLPPSMVGLAATEPGALMWVAGSWLQDRDEAHLPGALSRNHGSAGAGRSGTRPGRYWCRGCGHSVGVAAGRAGRRRVGRRGTGDGPGLPGQHAGGPGPQSAQAGLAAASLQVAETVGIAAGAGAGGALISIAAHLERGLSVGLGWAFFMTACAIVLAMAAAIRLVPAAASPPGVAYSRREASA